MIINCSGCGREIDDDDVFETYHGYWYCERCLTFVCLRDPECRVEPAYTLGRYVIRNDQGDVEAIINYDQLLETLIDEGCARLIILD